MPPFFFIPQCGAAVKDRIGKHRRLRGVVGAALNGNNTKDYPA